MQKYLLLLCLIMGALSCNVRKSSEYKNVLADKEFYERKLQEREKELETITRSMARIENNLSMIGQNEEIMETLWARNEIDQAERIDTMIAKIGAYLQENKQIVSQVESKLKTSLHKNAGLIALLEQQRKVILQKERQIQQLRDTITMLRDELQIVAANRDLELLRKDQELTDVRGLLQEREQTIRNSTESAATGYYWTGSKKQLLTQRIGQYKGGVLGLGSSLRLSGQVKDSVFLPVDTRNFRKLDLGRSNKPKLISLHPSHSYYFTKTEGRTQLHITNPGQFWNYSKYLVVVTD